MFWNNSRMTSWFTNLDAFLKRKELQITEARLSDSSIKRNTAVYKTEGPPGSEVLSRGSTVNVPEGNSDTTRRVFAQLLTSVLDGTAGYEILTTQFSAA